MNRASASAMTLAKRWGAGLALLVLLCVTVAAGAGNFLRNQPELALRIAPWDARATGRLSQLLLTQGMIRSERTQELAAKALVRDPTIVSAVVTTGLLADIKGRRATAINRFKYAAWLSRRDLPTEIWWIEHSVAQGDIASALHHYDIALRTNREAPDQLFPILGNAITEHDIRRQLIPLLRTKPLWRDRFFEWLVFNGVNNRPAALLISAVREPNSRIPADLFGRLEQRLIDQKDYETAWNFYRQRHVRARRDAARDINDMAASSDERSPFAWNVPVDEGGASISQANGRYVLTFATIPTNAAILAQQFLLLPPGNYRLNVDATLESGSGDSVPYWALQCADGQHDLGRMQLSGKPQIFTVPANCPAQRLLLRNDASDAMAAATGTVRAVQLTRQG